MKNILILSLSYHPNTGGLETHLTDLVKEAVKRHKLYVLTYQPIVTKASGKSYEVGKNLEIKRLWWFGRGWFLKFVDKPFVEFVYLFPGIFFYGIYLLKNRKFDTIHAQGLVAGTAGVILGRLFKTKVIISTHAIYHFPKNSFYSRFVRFMLLRSNKILTLSKQSKNELIDLGMPVDKVDVFTYWIDDKIFRPKSKLVCRKAMKLKDNFYVLFVGRLVKEKGINELLKSAKITNESINFLIAGDGPMERDVSEASKENKNIHYMGKIDNKDIANFYNCGNITVVPSVHDEGFGRVILESLMCGVPVIAAKRGGIPEAMDESVGSLIEITPQRLAGEIEKYFKDGKLLEKKSKLAREFALSRYGVRNSEVIYKNYE